MSKNNKEAILYLLPAAVLFLVFYYWPLLQNMYLSFYSWNMVSPNMKYVGLENFTYILSSAELLKIMLNTFLFVAIMLVLNFVLPYLYSFVLGHIVQKFNAFYRSALFLPSTLSLAVASILFLWIYNPAVNVKLLNGHLVLCECACLVRADYRYTAKAFNSLQVLYNSLFLSHLLCAHSLNYCDNRA